MQRSARMHGICGGSLQGLERKRLLDRSMTPDLGCSFWKQVLSPYGHFLPNLSSNPVASVATLASHAPRDLPARIELVVQAGLNDGERETDKIDSLPSC